MGLTLTVLGACGSYPGPGQACSGYLVQSVSTSVWVDAGMYDRRQQSLGQHVHLFRRRLAPLHELDEAGAGRARQRHRRPQRAHGPLVRARSDGADRSDHTDPVVARHPHRGPHAGVDHTDQRHLVLEPQQIEGGRRRGVAGHDDHLHVVLVDQLPRDLAGELAHLVERPRAVRIPAGIAEVDEVLVGQQVDEGTRHRETAESTVEHPDGAVVHGTPRYRPDPRPPETNGPS